MLSESNELPSFSVSYNGEQDDDNLALDSVEMQRFLQDNNDLAQIINLLTYNQTYLELLDQLVAKVDAAIVQNRSSQATIRNKLANPSSMSMQRNKLMAVGLPCWPPYFKDSIGMVPNSNCEALRISRICSADPLMEEERRWNPREIEQLYISVCESLKDEQICVLETRKELLVNKLRKSGIETTDDQKQIWRDEIDRIRRRIIYIRDRPRDEFIEEHTDYSRVDWAKICARDFQGSRSIIQLKQKWCNEICPEYNRCDWTIQEDEKLSHLCRDISNWETIAEMLGTGRSSFRCFERSVYIRQSEHQPKSWTPEEDLKLRQLIMMHKVGEEIPWSKIAVYMEGRDKLACEYRYTRSISDHIRHGRWTEAEDMLLLKAVNKYGPQNWNKISDAVKARSALQCRDRWIHVLDHKRRDQPWSWEEHMRLLQGVRLFGRDEFSKIAKLIPGRNNMDVRMRIRLLVKYQIEVHQKGSNNVVFRHFASNYHFCKVRRKNAVEHFTSSLETKHNFHRNNFDSRLGFGSFVAKQITGAKLDYSNIKKQRTEEFNDWKVFGAGRWIKAQQKNPNEYDHEELMEELNKLSDEAREETIQWLKESDNRLRIEREQEEEIPEDPKEAKNYYDQMFSQERLDELSTQTNEYLFPRESDIQYYDKHKQRVSKIRIKKPPRKPKGRKKRKTTNRKKKSKLVKILENIDKLDDNAIEGLRYSDRMMVEFFKEIEEVSEYERRQYLLAKLCYVVRHRVHVAAVNKYKTDPSIKDLVFNSMRGYVKQIVDDPPAPIPVKPPETVQPEIKDTIVLPPNWQQMSLKEMIKLKLSPDLLSALAATSTSNTSQFSLPISTQTGFGVPIENGAFHNIAFQTSQSNILDTLTISGRVRRKRSSGGRNAAAFSNLVKNAIIMPTEYPAEADNRPIKRQCLDIQLVTEVPLSEILNKLLPPSLSTINAIDLYERKVKKQLEKVAALYRCIIDSKFDADAPGQSTGVDEGLVTDETRKSNEYALLKKRIYRIFFLPMAMRKAIRQVKDEASQDEIGIEAQQGTSVSQE